MPAAQRVPGSDSLAGRELIRPGRGSLPIVPRAAPNNREASRREADKAKLARRQQRLREEALARQRQADRRERRRQEEAKEEQARKVQLLLRPRRVRICATAKCSSSQRRPTFRMLSPPPPHTPVLLNCRVCYPRDAQAFNFPARRIGDFQQTSPFRCWVRRAAQGDSLLVARCRSAVLSGSGRGRLASSSSAASSARTPRRGCRWRWRLRPA